MKKKVLISSISALAVLTLASCGEAVKEGSYKKGSDGEYALVDYSESVNYSELNNKDVDIYINYNGESGITFRGTSWFNSVDGKTYTQGSILPTWSRIADLTKTNIREASGYTATSIDNAYTSIATAGYKSEVDSSRSIDLFYNSTDNLKKAGNSGTLKDLYPYIYPEGDATTASTTKMPNLYAYLEANPSIKQSITVSGNHIYYTPYLDGDNEVANTFIMDTEIVSKVLASLEVGDTSKKNGGTTPDKNVLQTGAYKSFIQTVAATVDVYYNGEKKTFGLDASAGNIIDEQNQLLQATEGCTGKALANQLFNYIKTKYAALFTANVYKTPADLYISESAAYNTDELIALMRVIKANPGVITGSEDNEVEVFFPRGETAASIDNIYDLAQLWGVQGVDSENGNYYFAADGTLNSLETTYASYDALNYISAIYNEGLILDNFYVSSATPTSTRFYDQYFKKTKENPSYGFMMYDDPSIVAQANDSEFANTQGIRSVLPPRTYWSTEKNTAQQHLYDENGITITEGKSLVRYYESNRSLQTTSWSIPASSDSVDAALRIMDFMYSNVGQLIQNYGPENYWMNSTLDSKKVSNELVAGEENAIISDYTRLELASSQLDFWSFMRGYVGATHGIGYVRLSGLNLQVTNQFGRVGLTNINKAIQAGVLEHALSNAQNTATASTFTWNRSVPTEFATAVTDTNGDWDGITGFWATNKVNKNEGWVNLVVTPYNEATAQKISDGTDETLFVIKTAKNGNKITYKDMFSQMSARDSKCLWLLARSLGDACVPGYINEK